MKIDRTLHVRSPVAQVFNYLADFTTTQEWDPGTVRTRRISGDGGVGTRYHNVSRFLGRRTELEYVVDELQEPRLIKLRGRNSSVTAQDIMELAAEPEGGTVVRYRAQFAFHGVARLATPLLRPALRRLGDRAARQLGATLEAL